jgi:hypothetical protein
MDFKAKIFFIKGPQSRGLAMKADALAKALGMPSSGLDDT